MSPNRRSSWACPIDANCASCCCCQGLSAARLKSCSRAESKAASEDGWITLFGEKGTLVFDRKGWHVTDGVEVSDKAAEIERPHLPNLERYYVHLQERAAYREHVMISFEDMRGR